jgi:hypothetical protein
VAVGTTITTGSRRWTEVSGHHYITQRQTDPGHIQTVRALVERRLKMHPNDRLGLLTFSISNDTAVHEAALACHAEVVEILFPPPVIRGNKETIIVHWAIRAG